MVSVLFRPKYWARHSAVSDVRLRRPPHCRLIGRTPRSAVRQPSVGTADVRNADALAGQESGSQVRFAPKPTPLQHCCNMSRRAKKRHRRCAVEGRSVLMASCPCSHGENRGIRVLASSSYQTYQLVKSPAAQLWFMNLQIVKHPNFRSLKRAAATVSSRN